MSERAARSGRRARLSRRTVLAASIVALVASLVALAVLLKPRPAPPGRGPTEGAPAVVTVDGVDLKREPRAASETVARLPRGSRVEVRRDDGLWIEVSANGASGFVPSDSLERDSERQARERRAGTILSFTPVAGVVAEDTDLLLAPFPMAPRAGRLEKGTTVRIYSVDHAYYALRGPDGGLAFVQSARVDIIPPDPHLPPVVAARERALKNLEVTDVSEPVPEAPGEEQIVLETTPAPGAPSPAAPAAPSGGQVLEAAALVTRVDPSYPERARRAGAEGTVVLDATIGPDGRVVRVDVVHGLPFGLSEAAVDAVRRWRYRPARGPAGPILSHKEVRIEFRLRS